MRFDPLELEALRSQMLQKYTPESYCQKAADAIASMLGQRPDHWQHFGPYWGVVQALLLSRRPDLAAQVQDWGTPPDYLAHYDAGDEMLNAIAALQYLNRDGEYIAPSGPHSIEMPDGSNALYYPGIGIAES